MVKSLTNSHTGGRNGFLLIALLALMILFPFLVEGVVRYALLNLLISIVLIAGVYAESYEKKHFILGLIFGTPALIMSWLTITNTSTTIQLASVLTAIPFYIYIIISLFIRILRSNRVTLNEIYGAVSIYLLIGIVWSYFYNLVNRIVPNSFAINIPDHIINGADLLYYSFITLATVGYGDITPISNYARA